jgi:CheY-like chemotaxis protein
MFNEYQTEIFAIVALLIVSIIYFVVKTKFKKTKRDIQHLDEIAEPEIQEDSFDQYDTPLDSVDEFDIPNELEGKEEGSFGAEVTMQQEPNPQEPNKTEEKSQAKIIKREVPPHDKITKENFKEFAGSRILVAEDNIINQKVIQGLLASSGIEVVIADDGQIALDILENDTDFLLILMDAHMPRVDGFEATRIIRANPKYDHILVVALSGDTAADDIKKMTDAGMQEHLEKPLRMADLYDIFYAYSGDKPSVNPSEIFVVMTQELNGDKGLEVCGGDEEFYHEILNEFTTTYKNSAQTLLDMLHEHKLQEADQLLLDIVGVTANIGAKPLNEVALQIKNALDDTNEKSYITLVEQYKAHLEALILDIKSYQQI